MYRPTVRYDDVYRTFVNKVFQATTLDRNQIIRLALFTAAYSKDFYDVLNKYKKADVPLPSPLWSMNDHVLWLEKSPQDRERGDVYGENEEKKHGDNRGTTKRTIRTTPVASGNIENGRTQEGVERKTERRQGEVPAEPIPIRSDEGGTITWTFN